MRGKGGVILNNSSVHEIIPKPKYLPYSISKGGMENLTKTLALEYAGRGMRVNAVGSGAVVTPINSAWIDNAKARAEVESHIAMDRAAGPEEIASVFAFVASDDASYITGRVGGCDAVAGQSSHDHGARGGLGTYVTQSFLNEGADVAGVSRSIRGSDLDEPAFAPIPAELSTGDAARAVAATVVERWRRLDALVHLLGGFAGGNAVRDTVDADLERMLDLNLRSAFYAARSVLPHMQARGFGRILAIGSRAENEPPAGLGVYSASKAASVSLIRTLALENRNCGITANIILPGTLDARESGGDDRSRFLPLGGPKTSGGAAGAPCVRRRHACQRRSNPGAWRKAVKGLRRCNLSSGR